MAQSGRHWLEPDLQLWEEQNVEVVDTLLCPSDGVMKLVLTNYLGFSQWLEAGRDVRTCEPIEVVGMVPKDVDDCPDVMHIDGVKATIAEKVWGK